MGVNAPRAQPSTPWFLLGSLGIRVWCADTGSFGDGAWTPFCAWPFQWAVTWHKLDRDHTQKRKTAIVSLAQTHRNQAVTSPDHIYDLKYVIKLFGPIPLSSELDYKLILK